MKKAKFANLAKRTPKSPIGTPPKQWHLFVGDKVQIMTGRKDVGKTGKILSVDRFRYSVTVEGLNQAIKHVKPNPNQPQGGRVTIEKPIAYQSVQLVDPVLNQPTKVKLLKVSNPTRRRNELTRFSFASQTYIPIPLKPDEFSERDVGPLDTHEDLVTKITFTPQLFECPFPAKFLNQVERFKRIGKEGQAL